MQRVVTIKWTTTTCWGITGSALQSVAKAATEEVAKFDTESTLYDDLDGSDGEEATKKGLPEPLMRAAAAAVALAAAVTLAAITPVGPWIAREVEIVGAMVAKVTAVVAAIVEKIPWPQPVHGQEGLWETITILFTSVIVRPASAHPGRLCCSAPPRADIRRELCCAVLGYTRGRCCVPARTCVEALCG